MQPTGKNFYIFFGHLAHDKHAPGNVSAGQQIATLGDYVDNENGGWSRHLHLQILTKLPPEGAAPDGYVSKDVLAEAQKLYPDPKDYFPNWHIQK